jgi:hypothetical protein
VGEIASGEKVIASRRRLRPLLARHPKLIALEMEAAGCAYACETVSPQREFIMIKSVSDFASASKGFRRTMKWRSYACGAAAAFAVGFIRSGLLPQRRRSPTAKPQDGRTLLLDQEARAARGRVSSRLLALGFDEAETEAFTRDLLKTPLPTGITTGAGPLRLILGDFGAGKSLIAEKVHLDGLRHARNATHALIPVFLDVARLKSDSLQSAVGHAAEGLGSLARDGTHLVVDGLDEMGADRAVDILQQARVLASTWPGSRIWLTSRPFERFLHASEAWQLPLLDEGVAASLVARAAGRSSSASLSGLSPDVRESARRPLFALLLGLQQRPRQSSFFRSEAEMLHSIVKSVVGSRSELWGAFSALAILSVDRGGGAVPVGELERSVAERLRYEHRLIVERDGCFIFSVPILSHWFAARAIGEGLVDVARLLRDPGRTDRWGEALALFVSDGSAAQVDETMTVIAQRSPALGGILIQKAVPTWGLSRGVAAPPWREAGHRLHRAMVAWTRGIGPLARQIAPLRPDGSVAAIAVRSNGEWLNTLWTQESSTEVIELVDPDPVGRSARPGVSAGWPWRWTIEDLGRRLKQHLERIPATTALVHETVWDIGRLLKGYGSLYQGEIELDIITTLLAQVRGRFLRWEDVIFDLQLIRPWVNARTHRPGKSKMIESPYPGPDIQVGSWVWDTYTLKRLLERTRSVYAVALESYAEMTTGSFAALADQFPTAQVLPAILHGRLMPGNGADLQSEPTLITWFEPLLQGDANLLDFEIAPRNFRLQNYEDLWAEVRRRRPRISSWGYQHGGADVHEPRPATRIALGWLRGDLKRLGWLT